MAYVSMDNFWLACGIAVSAVQVLHMVKGQKMDGKDAVPEGKSETGIISGKLRLHLTGLLWTVPLLHLQRFDFPKKWQYRQMQY